MRIIERYLQRGKTGDRRRVGLRRFRIAKRLQSDAQNEEEIIRINIISLLSVSVETEPQSGSLQQRRPATFVIRSRQVGSFVSVERSAFRRKLRCELYTQTTKLSNYSKVKGREKYIPGGKDRRA